MPPPTGLVWVALVLALVPLVSLLYEVAGKGAGRTRGGIYHGLVVMIPIVVRSAEEILKLVPTDLREASYALGVPKRRTTLRVVLPTALPGIITGITVAAARVIGKTAPLWC